MRALPILVVVLGLACVVCAETSQTVRGLLAVDEEALPFVTVSLTSNSGTVLANSGKLGVNGYFELSASASKYPNIAELGLRVSTGALPKKLELDSSSILKIESVGEREVSPGVVEVRTLKVKLTDSSVAAVIREKQAGNIPQGGGGTASWTQALMTVSSIVALFYFRGELVGLLESFSAGPRKQIMTQQQVKYKSK